MLRHKSHLNVMLNEMLLHVCTLRWIDAQSDEPLWVQQRELDYLSELLNGIFGTTNIIIRDVRLFFHGLAANRGKLK